ncbi:MAG: phosphoribosylformylglycinamidine synthase I [Longilinea sp.]|nr:phosphoribosylformylglycinamidine synthase I [Longilinea sp.]
MKPKALILKANGTNRDEDAAAALRLAGAEPDIVPLNLLRNGERHFEAYQLLIIPGGFSYADALGAGKLLALDLNNYFADQVNEFVMRGLPVLGICNGFQALVKSGILPGVPAPNAIPATLTFNQSGHFECRWVTLRPISQRCLWTRGLNDQITCPVAHGEGNFVVSDPLHALALEQADQIALRYTLADGTPANGQYPENPNGSILDIAGICNPAGNVLGLMPHPEDHILPHQHPHWTRRTNKGLGLSLFQNGVQYATEC